MKTSTQNFSGTVAFEQIAEGTLVVRITGEWKMGANFPRADRVLDEIQAGAGTRRIVFKSKALTGWDSGLLTFLTKIIECCESGGIDVDRTGLPTGVNRLLDLALAVPERKGARRVAERIHFVTRTGVSAIAVWDEVVASLHFVGEAFVAFLRLLVGRAHFRRSDLFLIIQDVGARSLPIVSLISLLVGLIFAFVGAIQLRMFGAQIYVANLVGIAMTREMGAVMTGIIMAGRTGASFAAQLGTMVVNEEVDSLKTLGIPPMEFLVLPRMLALVLMMPLLCLYADLMGILGGLLVGVTMLDLNVVEYYNQTREAIRLNDVWIGLFMSVVFGVLIAQAGCMRGLRCGRSSAAVGTVTTSAVVTGIVSIIVATAVITIICDILGL